jgi:hypothetical protein
LLLLPHTEFCICVLQMSCVSSRTHFSTFSICETTQIALA